MVVGLGSWLGEWFRGEVCGGGFCGGVLGKMEW